MARAKNTARAEARRRHRAARAAAFTESDQDALDDELDIEGEQEPEPPRRSRFALPDIRADLRAFPGMFRTRKLLWVPFLLVLSAFGLGMAANAGVLPADLAGIAGAYAQLVLPPQALIVYFIGGFLAPRGSYLVGLLLGLLTGPLFITWIWTAPGGAEEASALGYTFESLAASYAVQGALFGMVAGGFASWYRGFLRSSQERARMNRIARDQQQRIKAKEQERKDREAAREARKPAAQKPT